MEETERPQLSLHVRLSERQDLSNYNAIQGTLFTLDGNREEVGYRGVVEIGRASCRERV